MFKQRKLAWIVLAVLFCLNLVAWFIVYDLRKSQPFKVVFFDVGQGDSIFIEAPNGVQVLIDGGPTSVVLEKLAKEMPFYDRDIDLIILTHPEHDHYFGLMEVLKRYKVENILWTGVVRETSEWKEWINLLGEEGGQGAEIRIAEAGQRIIFQEDPLIFIEILHPFENLAGQKFKGCNDTSVVTHLFFEDVSFLFTGDIGKKVEAKLVEQDIDLDSDVLKVCHHGSKTSSSQEFLEAVLPKIAVIQAGRDNRYGHPCSEVLASLEKFDIQILRTDINGNIKIISDGRNIKIEKEK